MSNNVTVIDIVAQVTDETAAGTRSATNTIGKLETAMKKVEAEVNKMLKMSKIELTMYAVDKASKVLNGVWNTGKKLAGKVWNVTLKAVDLVTAPVRGIFKILSNPIVAFAGMAGVSLGVKEVVSTFMSFEQTMANVRAITGASEEDFNKLNAAAKELGATTVFSASEAAEGMTYLGMAGWKTNDIIAAMPGLLNLAAAGATDLGTAADIVSDVMTAFNMEASEAGRAADIFAAAASNSNTSITMLGESFTYAGALAGTYGYELGEVTTALGLMANAGVKGSMGGTAFQAMIQGLADTSGESGKVLKKLGIQMFDSTGKAKPFKTVMNDLRQSFKGLTDQEKANYATTIAGERGMKGLLAIVNAADEDYDKLTAAIEGSTGAASKMANIQMNTLSGGFKLIQSAAEDIYIALGERLAPYLKEFQGWLIDKMPQIKNIAVKVADAVVEKIESVRKTIGNMVQSPAWQNATTLWDKIKVAWDTLIAKPFDEWWNGSGKAWLEKKMNSVGRGIGSALKGGINALLGIDTGDALADGASIGKSFVDGFLEGFDGAKVAEAIKKVLSEAFKIAYSNPVTGTMATAYLGSKALSGVSTAYKGVKAVKNGINAVKGVSAGLRTGSEIATAARGGGAAAQSALAFAQNGAFGTSARLGATKAGSAVVKGASKAASVGTKAIPIIGGLMSLAEMGVDAYHGVGKAKEWTGSDSLGNKIASGAGAFLGGTGGGVFDKTKGAGAKALEVGGGTLKGAGIGAAVGSVVPVIGTAVGGAVGAVVGGVGAAIGGENIAKALSAAGKGIAHFFTKMLPDFFGMLWKGISGFFTETIPNALSAVGNAVRTFFTETIPVKFGELIDSIKAFFGETIPYAIGFVVGSVTTFITQTVPNAIAAVGEALVTFFTETVPNFFQNLWGGIVGFFTETVPASLEMIGNALGTFFTETVPNFFVGLWEGAVEFFTEKVPAAVETIGAALGTFFTETVPNFFTQLWDGAVGFFTETIPNAIDSVKEGISGFFTKAKEKITGFFSGIWDGITSFFGGAAESFSAGYSDATAHAQGGIMTSPHLGLVAEDGAEAIIPLTKHDRGIALWEKTGELLGVKQYSQGGIVGATPTPTASAGGGMVISVPVTIANVSFEVHADSGSTPSTDSIIQIIKDNIENLTDELAYRIGTALQQVFANMPTVAEGV